LRVRIPSSAPWLRMHVSRGLVGRSLRKKAKASGREVPSSILLESPVGPEGIFPSTVSPAEYHSLQGENAMLKLPLLSLTAAVVTARSRIRPPIACDHS